MYGANCLLCGKKFANRGLAIAHTGADHDTVEAYLPVEYHVPRVQLEIDEQMNQDDNSTLGGEVDEGSEVQHSIDIKNEEGQDDPLMIEQGSDNMDVIEAGVPEEDDGDDGDSTATEAEKVVVDVEVDDLIYSGPDDAESVISIEDLFSDSDKN